MENYYLYIYKNKHESPPKPYTLIRKNRNIVYTKHPIYTIFLRGNRFTGINHYYMNPHKPNRSFLDSCSIYYMKLKALV